MTTFIPITAMSEAITTTKWKKERPELVKILVDLCTNGKITLIDVSTELLPLATSYFQADGSKHNTFFDAIIAACAKKYNAVAIFSFNKWYQKQGFKLASELLNN